MEASGQPREPWATTLERELERVAKASKTADRRVNRHRPSMFRVPSYIKKLNPTAYDHQVLSFGLYTRDFEKMTRMDEVRLEVVSHFLEQMKSNSRVDSWEALCELVAGPQGSAQYLQDLYDDGPGEDLVTPMTVRSVLTFDAVFLTLFSRFYTRKFGDIYSIATCNFEPFDRLFREPGVNHILSRVYIDMWLAENQIPLHLFRAVWNQLYVDNSDHCFNTYMRHTICIAIQTYLLPQAEIMLNRDHDHGISFLGCDHLLHCLYIVVCHQSSPESEPPAAQPSIQESAPYTSRSLLPMTELLKAGIVVRGWRSDVSGIKFVKSTCYKSTLYVPQIDIDDNTETILRNLVVFEMIHSHEEHKLISCLSIMDDLINTEGDVRLLRKGKDPITGVNFLGDDEDIAALFNALGRNVIFQTSEQCKRLITEVNDCCRKDNLQKHVIRFVDRFSDRPWILGSLVAASLLLVMTAIQTVYAIMVFHRE